jgi:hypothetical protein
MPHHDLPVERTVHPSCRPSRGAAAEEKSCRNFANEAGHQVLLVNLIPLIVLLRPVVGVFDISLASLLKRRRIARTIVLALNAVLLRPFIAGPVTLAVIDAGIPAEALGEAGAREA